MNDSIEALLGPILIASEPERARLVAELLTERPEWTDELLPYLETLERVERCGHSLGLVGGSPSFAAGRFVGEYELLEEIGRGGMGVVYRAKHPVLHRTIALKLLRPDACHGDDRLLVEARSVAQLDHVGIVPIFEVGWHEGRAYLAMAYIEGESLAELSRRRVIPPKECARIIRDAAEAVQHAHDRGIVHRDLKPSNILIASDGQVKVADFELAKRTGEATLTATGQVIGTPAFMPPEFARGEAHAATPAADVYGLGACFYAILTRSAPFCGDTPLETLRCVVDQAPASPRLREPRVDRSAETVCLHCLEKEPSHRYASAKELAEDLTRYLNDQVPHVERIGWWSRLSRRLSRRIEFRPAQYWSQLLMGLAALFVLCHLALSIAIREGASATVFGGLYLGSMTITTWLPMAVAWRGRSLQRPEGEILTSWAGVSIGEVVMYAVWCPLRGPLSVDAIGHYYSAATVLYSAMFFGHGRTLWGRLYLFAILGLMFAILMPRAGTLAPLIHGGWLALALGNVGIYLRRLAKSQRGL